MDSHPTSRRIDIAHGNGILIGKSLQRQPGQITLQQLIGKKRRPVVVPHHRRVVRMAFANSTVQDVLDALIRVLQYLGVSIRLMDQAIASVHAIALW